MAACRGDDVRKCPTPIDCIHLRSVLRVPDGACPREQLRDELRDAPEPSRFATGAIIGVVLGLLMWAAAYWAVVTWW